jgi:hypothetical protein
MTDQPEHVDRDAATDEQRTAARESFRAKRAAARARHTPEYWAQLRNRIGLPARTA